MLWRTHAHTVRCVHSCPALHDNKVSWAVHLWPALYDNKVASGARVCLRARSIQCAWIRHYARGQRSRLPDSAIMCMGRNPIDIISPEMGRKKRVACALHTRIPRNMAWGCLSIIGLGTRSMQRGRRAGCVSCVVKNTIRAAWASY